MKRLKSALEDLDEEISVMEDQVGLYNGEYSANLKKHADILKQSRTREAGVLAVAQKVAARLDQAIHHVEHILRD